MFGLARRGSTIGFYLTSFFLIRPLNNGIRAGGRRARFTFWLTFFQSCMLPLFFNGLLSYLVGIKRRTSRCVTCNRDNSYCVRYVFISPDVRMPQVYLLVNLFSKLYTTFILQRNAFVFGRDGEEDQ